MGENSLMILKRDGKAVEFDATKITGAVKKAFLFDQAGVTRLGADTQQTRALIDTIGHAAVEAVKQKAAREGAITVRIEDIQDQVELALMRSGEHAVARDFVLYRQRRAEQRASAGVAIGTVNLRYKSANGELLPINRQALIDEINAVVGAHGGDADYAAQVVDFAIRDLYDGVPESDVRRALILASRMRIERDPVFNKITAAIVLRNLRKEVFVGQDLSEEDNFPRQIATGIKIGMYNPVLAEFDVARLGAALKPDRDGLFGFVGLQTVYDRYLVVDKTAEAPRRIETPQGFLMRVAMGLALNEADREARAIEFYDVLSQFDFMSSTPTLFNSGTRHSQMSSCYLSTVPDDLCGIYDAIKDNAMLQKFAGGMGNDWTQVRALGSLIKGTNGESQGTIPFLKVVNDTAVAVNQGGKRQGAVCSFMETWHLDIEQFLELRKNTGDDRRRTHDMNTANWIPDLFMKRVMENGSWTLFSPSDVPDLHDLYGKAFEQRYSEYESMAERGEIRLHKKVAANELWRKMLTMLFETGHPWITFKDPMNLRSPQQHAGVVHSSNLCTEIALNTGPDEIAVCNLGSVNLVNHMISVDGAYVINREKLQATVRTAMRMLDNVIDLNLYSVKKARTSNLRHRPVGLGMMGFQDCLHLLRLPFASKEAVRFASESAEAVCFEAYFTSTMLAEERGRYSSFKGSLWDQGVLPQDSLQRVTDARGAQYHKPVEIAPLCAWTTLRDRITKFGMRNSNCVAIAPTATISNIVDVSACIEPAFQNLYVMSNLSGEFTVINEYLVRDLQSLGLWDEEMIADMKFYDGAVSKIARVPKEIKVIYATAFENDPSWYVEAGSARQRWIDQAQSLNLYVAGASGKKLDELYKLAWVKGLKTTYYLRTMAATSAEKSTGKGGELNAVSAAQAVHNVAVAISDNAASIPDLSQSEGKFCSLDDVMNGSCESCQ